MDEFIDGMILKIYQKQLGLNAAAKQKRDDSKKAFAKKFFNSANEGEKRIIKAVFKSPFHENSAFSQSVSKIFADQPVELVFDRPNLFHEDELEK